MKSLLVSGNIVAKDAQNKYNRLHMQGQRKGPILHRLDVLEKGRDNSRFQRTHPIFAQMQVHDNQQSKAR